MNALQRNQLRASEIRTRLNELSGLDELTEEQRSEMDALVTEYTDVEAKVRAGLVAQDEADAAIESHETPEAREFAELQDRVEVRNYAQAALRNQYVQGAEAEFNQELGLSDPGAFPLRLLAPEVRETTDTESGVSQQMWLDRLFADTAAMRLGITMPSVAPGVQSYPITLTGPTPAQRGREQAADDGTWTTNVTEIKPTRNTVRTLFTREDALRLPGLEDALRRDLGNAMTEAIDRAIFVGDSGADEARADIAGLQTKAIGEITITQTNKVKGDKVLEAFAGLVDGIHAGGTGDLNVVITVGTYRIWVSTITNSAADNQTVGAFLGANGLSWQVRGGIETASANGDFGAFVGLNRGIAGAGVAPVWDAGELIRDPYTEAASGQVALTLGYYWGFELPRPSSFRRVKYVT